MTRAKKPEPITHEEIVRHLRLKAEEHERWVDVALQTRPKSRVRERSVEGARYLAAIYREAIRRLEEWDVSHQLTMQARRARRKP